MAQKPLRPCGHSGCALVTRDGFCAAHKPKQHRKSSAGYHGLYSLSVWDKLRGDQLLLEPFCRACAAMGERTQATVVDHVIPHRGDIRLFMDKTNLQSLCKHHHDQKTMLENMKRKR